QTSGPANPNPKGFDPELDFPSDLTVKVRTQTLGNATDGAISDLAIRGATGQEEQVDGRGEAAMLARLKAKLIQKREELQHPAKNNIKVQGDGKLKVRS